MTDAPKQIWAVFQEGIYRHACVGVFDTESAAVAAANATAWNDNDCYHQYDVVALQMNISGGEEAVVWSVSKTGRTLGRPELFPATVNRATQP